jgi:diaminohydroxyphosphoribosylaminopyrimidine deaminase/5-amino-6-(5-phosphoribosylamino)uracil reductase
VRETPTWVFAGKSASPVGQEILTDRGVRVFRVEASDGMLDLDAILKTLASEGITRLMVEGGPTVAANLVRQDLVDEAVLLRSAKALGDGGLDALKDLPLRALTQSVNLALSGVETLGDDRAEYYERA